MKSLIYAANSTAQTSDTVNFGSIIRRYGCNLSLSGGNVAINGAGYYDVDVNLSFTAGAAGAVSVALYKNGAAIPGATATVTATQADTYSVSIPAILRQTCAAETNITAVITGDSVTINNAAISVVKL